MIILKLLTGSGLGVVNLTLNSGKCYTETSFSLTQETVEFMLIGVNGLMSIMIVLSRWLGMSELLYSINFKLFLVGLIQSFWTFVECSCTIGDIARLIENDVDRMCWVLKLSFLNVTADSINILEFRQIMSDKLSFSNI